MARPLDRDGELYRRTVAMITQVASGVMQVSLSCCLPGSAEPCGEKSCARCLARKLLEDLKEGA